MSRFSLSNVVFTATTSKLDKDLQDDKERYTTRHRDKKRDMACHLIVVIRLQGIAMITVYGIDYNLNVKKAQMSDVLHNCMTTVLGLPEDKRAHRFVPLDKTNFYYPGGRSEKYTVIEISMISGRTEETKKKLIKQIFTAFERNLAINPVDVEITIFEQPSHCWGFRGITGDEATLSYRVNV
jgi:phenylpyruvate tautomerase PptA (4-oxalocrotonate tautomerase family)